MRDQETNCKMHHFRERRGKPQHVLLGWNDNRAASLPRHLEYNLSLMN